MTDVTPKDVTTVERSEGNCYVALTHDHLDVLKIMDLVRSPKAGAIVLFAGTYPGRSSANT
jgi:molybdopterin synthase catalytic subunit